MGESDAKCLIYSPMPYNGRGPTKSCLQIAEQFPHSFSDSCVFLPKSRGAEGQVRVRTGLPTFLNKLPWRYVKRTARRRLDAAFAKELRNSSPASSIAYFWPAPSLELLDIAERHGLLTVREMINCCTGTAKSILDDAFGMAGLPPRHTISDADVEREREELSKYNYIFSSNKEVDTSLVQAGVDEKRILKTSFGWNLNRFNRFPHVPKSGRFTAIFVGTIGIRKGIPQLLRAWELAKIPGELVLIGDVDPECRPLLSRFSKDDSIKVISYTDKIEALYKSSHLFVFPTLEEGGPQVTYEAAGCGLPTLTTPMGAGRIITDGRNGLIVAAGDVQPLADGLKKMFEDQTLRAEFAENARLDAAAFTYDMVGRQRAEMLRSALQRN